MMHGWDVGRKRYSPIKQYSFWSLNFKYDLDIWGTGLSLVRDKPPYHGECLCQVSWKSYDALLRCRLNKVQSYQAVLISIFDLKCDLDIWGTGLALEILWRMVKMQATEGSDRGTHRRTHINTPNRHCDSYIKLHRKPTWQKCCF